MDCNSPEVNETLEMAKMLKDGFPYYDCALKDKHSMEVDVKLCLKMSKFDRDNTTELCFK